jgi:hypothetical protein
VCEAFSKRLAQDLEYMADEVVPWGGFAEIAGFARLRPRTWRYAGYCWTDGEPHLLLKMKASPGVVLGGAFGVREQISRIRCSPQATYEGLCTFLENLRVEGITIPAFAHKGNPLRLEIP